MNANVDLRQLSVRRDGQSPSLTRRRKHLLTRVLLPGVVLGGFLAVIAWAARDSLLPSKPVTVVPVLTTRTEMRQEGTPLFQAAGWIEPRPTPILVTALAEGVIDKLLVVEGQQVKAGEPVAYLIDSDAKLAIRTADADVRLRKAETISAKAGLKAAQTNLAKPVHLEASLAEAEALLAQKETELGNLPFGLNSAEARLSLARTNFENLSSAGAGGFVSGRSLLEAENELKAATALVDELKSREPRLKLEVKALTSRQNALRNRLELKTEELRQLSESEAQVEVTEAKLQQAQAALETAHLRLDRMTVKAPVAGTVLALVSRPGTRLMGQAAVGHQEASTVVMLYDPNLLQVRADVRLEDVPRVLPGQAVKIETPAAPGGSLDGVVLFSTSQANIQKNTLEVKVAIKSPPPVIRPEMLVQVTFLAAATPQAKDINTEFLRLLVPRQLIDSGDGSHHVWVADQSAGVARSRTLKLGVAVGDWVEVIEGLNPADKLIASGREGLREGQRITITGEEAGIGSIQPQNSGTRPARLPQQSGADHHGKR